MSKAPKEKPSGEKAEPLPAPAYDGDQEDDRLPYEGPPIRTRPDADDRGRRAVREGSGVVSGSGADAGGTGGSSEDYDTDSVGGGGAPTVMPTPHKGQ